MNNLSSWVAPLLQFLLPLTMVLALYLALKINQYIENTKKVIAIFDKKLSIADNKAKESTKSLIYS